MAKKIPVILIFLLIAGAAVYFFVFNKDNDPKPEPDNQYITIFWAQWPPADYLDELSRDFTRETGIRVRVVQEPWGTWQTVFFDAMKAKKPIYDMVIGDSQWLGRGSTAGHYIELTKWMKEHRVDQTMIPAAVTGYSEFPKGSGKYWAIPVEGDAMGFSYRKDLFEHPDEKREFREKYGYELKVPDTWFQLRDIAEFFYRPERDFYGVLIWVEPDYDGITMGIDTLLWAWGADLGDRKSYRVKGILNSAPGIEALKFYKELNRFNNPKWTRYYLDTKSNSNLPMMQGKVAMSMGYFAINPDLLDPKKNPYANVTGFFANPRGPKARVASLGGQGISLISYSKKKEPCFKFLDWFVKDHVQAKWARLGGLSCNKKVLNSPGFLNASPINRPFKESIEMVKDFWAVPEYPQLLKISQEFWFKFITTDQISAAEAMNTIAEKWENIFEYAGYYKE